MKKTILLFTLLTLVVFSSCDKSDLKKKAFDKKEWDKDYDKEKEVCFDLVYPVTYIMPDGSTITGDNQDAIWDAMKVWYNANDSEEKPSLQYPVDVIFEEDDGTSATETVANEDEMIAIKKECYDEYWEWDCFEIVYPIIYIMPDGYTITGNNEDEVWDALKTWYEDNPDSEEKAQLQYPVEVTYDDDNGGIITETINNDDEMIAAKHDCKDEWDWDCFELVFPITVGMPDNSTITGNDKNELETNIEAWYTANPDVEEKPELQYPLDIIFDDQSTQTINNKDEMETAKEECDD